MLGNIPLLYRVGHIFPEINQQPCFYGTTHVLEMIRRQFRELSNIQNPVQLAVKVLHQLLYVAPARQDEYVMQTYGQARRRLNTLRNRKQTGYLK